MIKSEITLIFDHGLTLRSYIESGALRELQLRATLSLVILDRKISSEYLYAMNSQGIWPLQLQSRKLIRYLLLLHSLNYWVRRQHLSKGFASRLRSMRQGRREFYDKKDLYPVSIFKIFKRRIDFILAGLIRRGLPKSLLLLMGRTTFSKIKEADYFYFITVGGAESYGDVLCVYLKAKYPESRFFYVAENWDNLETKAVIWRKPDAIGAWAELDFEVMSKIHKVNVDRIRIVGSPRQAYVASLVGNARRKKASHQSSEVILYACGGSNFDAELKRFKKIESIIAPIVGSTIVFLPHPRSYRDYVIYRNENTTVNLLQRDLDYKIFTCYEEGRLLSLRYLANLLAKSSLVLSSLSTMALESTTLGIKTIVIDIAEPIGDETVWATDYFNYISVLKKLKGVWILRDILNLKSILDLNFTNSDSSEKNSHEQNVSDLSTSFIDRLLALRELSGN